jgi:Phytochelatin synthase
LIRVVGIPLSILSLLACVGIWNAAFRAPSIDLQPLPDGLVAVESPAGRELLADKDFVADHESLTKNFESQSRPAFCGVASSVIVLNALGRSGPRLTQATFFTDSANKVRSSLQVTFGGMSLAELGDLLRAHGAEVTLFYASDASLAAFREIARTNLETPGDFLLVNYQRAALGQEKTGHISPVAAYHSATDRLLILDVAAYKYPPVWVSTKALWDAMNTMDSASGRTRGFLVVRGTQQVVPVDGSRAAGSPRP